MKIFVTGTISFSELKELHEKMLILYGKDIQFMHTATTDIVRFETKKERYKARIKALLESDILVVPYVKEFQQYRQIEIEIAEHCSMDIVHENEIDSKLLSKLMEERDDQNEAAEKLKVIREHSGYNWNVTNPFTTTICGECIHKESCEYFGDGTIKIFCPKFDKGKKSGDKTSVSVFFSGSSICLSCPIRERCCLIGVSPDECSFRRGAHVRRNDASS